MIKWCMIGYQVTNYSNIFHAKYKGHQRLLMPDWPSLLYCFYRIRFHQKQKKKKKKKKEKKKKKHWEWEDKNVF